MDINNKLPDDLYNKLLDAVKSLVDSHKKSQDLQIDSQKKPPFGKFLVLENLSIKDIEQLNLKYYFKPIKVRTVRGLKQLASIVFTYYTKAINNIHRIDDYVMLENNIVEWNHQDPIPIFTNSVYRYMFPRPDLDEKQVNELIEIINNVYNKEKEKGYIYK